MNYEEFRKFGHISQLWRLRNGPSKSTMNTESGLVQSEINLANSQTQLAQSTAASSAADKAKADALQAPYILQQQQLASGDRNAVTAAAMPTISQISGATNPTIEAIKNSVPPGPARDAAIANYQASQSSTIATTEAGLVNQAPTNLANVGTQQYGFSLQELGAALSGLSGAGSSFGGASSSNQTLANMQTQSSQALWAPLISLASLAGSAATGGMFSGFSNLFSKSPKQEGPLYGSGG